MLAFAIEIASFLDLISDGLILYALYCSIHTMWLTITVFTISCPYFTCYTSLMNFHIAELKKSRSDNKKVPCNKMLTKFIFILPTMLVILIVIDLIYMLFSLFTKPFLFLIKMITCCKVDYLKKYSDSADTFFQNYFNMCYMDIQGFRTQRTILQLQLESIPQIIFQIYLAIRI